MNKAEIKRFKALYERNLQKLAREKRQNNRRLRQGCTSTGLVF